MRAEMAPRATAMLAYVPRIVIFESARTMRVRDEFSMMKRILPSCPARRPMARERWSPCSILTSLTSKDSCGMQRRGEDGRKEQGRGTGTHDVELLHAQHRDGVLDSKPGAVCSHEVGGASQR